MNVRWDHLRGREDAGVVLVTARVITYVKEPHNAIRSPPPGIVSRGGHLNFVFARPSGIAARADDFPQKQKIPLRPHLNDRMNKQSSSALASSCTAPRRFFLLPLVSLLGDGGNSLLGYLRGKSEGIIVCGEGNEE